MALQRVSTSSSQNQPSAEGFPVLSPHPRARNLPSSGLIPHPRVLTFSRTMRAFSTSSYPLHPLRPSRLFDSSTLEGPPLAGSTLHGRPQPLLAPCSPPVPRAGFCPASPAVAPPRRRAANLLLYQVEQAPTSAPTRRADFSPPPRSTIGLSPPRHAPLRWGLCSFVPLFLRFAHPRNHHALARTRCRAGVPVPVCL
jgi:hypothetical protein